MFCNQQLTLSLQPLRNVVRYDCVMHWAFLQPSILVTNCCWSQISAEYVRTYSAKICDQDAGHKFRRSTYVHTYVRTPPKFVTRMLVTNFGGLRTYVPASWSQISAEYVRTYSAKICDPDAGHKFRRSTYVRTSILVTNFGGARTSILVTIFGGVRTSIMVTNFGGVRTHVLRQKL